MCDALPATLHHASIKQPTVQPRQLQHRACMRTEQACRCAAAPTVQATLASSSLPGGIPPSQPSHKMPWRHLRALKTHPRAVRAGRQGDKQRGADGHAAGDQHAQARGQLHSREMGQSHTGCVLSELERLLLWVWALLWACAWARRYAVRAGGALRGAC